MTSLFYLDTFILGFSSRDESFSQIVREIYITTWIGALHDFTHYFVADVRYCLSHLEIK